MGIQRFIQQHISKDIPAVVRYLRLLARVTMILEAQYYGEVGCLESAFSDGFEDLFSADLWHERVAVDDDWFFCPTVPEVELDASAS